MAIASAMNHHQEESNNSNIISSINNKQHDDDDDEHEYDVVMPGFRFHPTEEELVEFYLRRKVEGKRFNVELITFLDLYRYDPWELPALAAIGEKEWYFYVPRDRKYRNGDRPNRVTTSGYWKATGADRMIRSENFRSIGLKKTLVFYSGKAPKGIRTSWIMNEYRLPLHETERLQKAEISLCRVYKRAGVEDHHPSLPRSLPTSRASPSSSSRISSTSANHQYHVITTHGSSKSTHQHKKDGKNISETISPSCSGNDDIALTIHTNSYTMNNDPLIQMASNTVVPSPTSVEEACNSSSLAIDDLHKLVNIDNYSQQQASSLMAAANLEIHPHLYTNNVVPSQLLSHFSTTLPPPPPPPPQPQPVTINGVPGSFQVAFSDRLWDWNAISEANNKDFTDFFK